MNLVLRMPRQHVLPDQRLYPLLERDSFNLAWHVQNHSANPAWCDAPAPQVKLRKPIIGILVDVFMMMMIMPVVVCALREVGKHVCFRSRGIVGTNIKNKSDVHAVTFFKSHRTSNV